MFFITPPKRRPGLDPPPPARCFSVFHLLRSTPNIHLLRQARRKIRTVDLTPSCGGSFLETGPSIIRTVDLTPSCGGSCGESAAFDEWLSLSSSHKLALSVGKRPEGETCSEGSKSEIALYKHIENHCSMDCDKCINAIEMICQYREIIAAVKTQY